MRHDRLLRSTPFRLAMTFGMLFVAGFLVAGLVTYQLLKNELAHALDLAVSEMYSVTASSYSSDDVEDLITTINTYAKLKTSDQRIFSLVDATGSRIAGNFTAGAMPDGLHTVDASSIGIDDDAMFRVFAGRIGTDRLVVGQSLAETDDLEAIALISFAWALVLNILMAVAGGVFLASRAQRRLDTIADTMIDVANGRMGARIPLRGNRDDIDRVSQQINDALERLARLVDSMRQVSADIAHELKTPLNRLKMTIEEAIDGNEKGNPVETLLLDAMAESDAINATFEALLRISQIEAGGRKARFQDVDLLSVMSSVAEIYTGVAEDSGQTLTFRSQAAGPCLVVGDRELLTQLFVNLVENAITHCPVGTRISMTMAMDGNRAICTVADNGPGIPAGEREMVFQRLYRLDKSRTTPGNGLGLSLARAIAELHLAELKLGENRPGLVVSLAVTILQRS